jgi:hypothetical protein
MSIPKKMYSLVLGACVLFTALVPSGLHISLCAGPDGHIDFGACAYFDNDVPEQNFEESDHCEHQHCMDLCFYVPERDGLTSSQTGSGDGHNMAIVAPAPVPDFLSSVNWERSVRACWLPDGFRAVSDVPFILRSVVLLI